MPLIALPLLGCSPSHDGAPLDPLGVTRSETGNDALHCPQDSCENPDQISPVFDVGVEAVFKAWMDVIENQPRTLIVATDPEKRLIHAEQRSLILRFVDTVLIRVEPVEQGASYIAFSRSELGRSDFGVNAERLEIFAEELRKRIGVQQ